MVDKATTGVGLWRDDPSIPGDCPRCGSPLPVGYPGALSRADNATEVCSACGTDEAMEGFIGKRPPTPTDQWPITREFQTDAAVAAQAEAFAELAELNRNAAAARSVDGSHRRLDQ